MSYKFLNDGDNIPLYSQTTNDWHYANKPADYAVNLDVGYNEYIFGRTTPDNKFVVSTGLVSDSHGVRMVGGKLKAKPKSKSDAKPKVKSDAKPKVKSDAKPKPKSKSDGKPKSKSDGKPKSKSDAKPKSKSDAKPKK